MPVWIWIQSKVERISVRYWLMPVCVGMRIFRVSLSKAERKNRKLSFILLFTIHWYIPISCKMSMVSIPPWKVIRFWQQRESVTLFSRFGIRIVMFTNSLRWFIPNVSYKWCVPCSICIANMVGYLNGNSTDVKRWLWRVTRLFLSSLIPGWKDYVILISIWLMKLCINLPLCPVPRIC